MTSCLSFFFKSKIFFNKWDREVYSNRSVAFFCPVIDKIWALMDMTFTQADPIKVQKDSTRRI